MKLFHTLCLIMKYSGKALAYAPFAIITVILAEGLQHYVEMSLDMYDSQEAFRAHKSDTLRLGFGILKAISVVSACYFIPKALTNKLGPSPQHGSFNKDFLRKLWSSTGGAHGMIAMFILAAPLVLLHYKLSELAMGHAQVIPLLILDSFLIGLLALTMGTSFWANDAANTGGY